MDTQNRVFVTGDLHGCQNYDYRKLTTKLFPEQKELTKNDYVIIAGDFGLVFNVNESNREEKYWLNWLEEKNFTTLFVDGNHENFDRLKHFDEVEMFEGKVGKINDSVFHLKRGEVYTINDKKILTMGGATSTDKEYRLEYFSWWRQEEPNIDDYNNCLRNFTKHKRKVDYIITHEAPTRIYKLFDFQRYHEPTQLQEFLDGVAETVDFKHWYFGHYHEDCRMADKFTVLYDTIKELV